MAWFEPEQRDALADFLRVYVAGHDQIIDAALRVSAAHPSFAPIVRSISPQRIAAERAETQANLTRALDGDWGPFEAMMGAAGEAYARLGVDMMAWSDVLSRGIAPTVLRLLFEAYGSDAARMARTFEIAQGFFSRVTALRGQAFLRTREQMGRDALQASEAHYRLIFDESPLAKFVFALDTLEFLDVNKAAIHLYGYSREEFLHRTIADIRPPDQVPAMLKQVADLRADGAIGVWRHRRKDGSLFDVELNVHAFTVGGRGARLVVARDVTERLRGESALREAEARFRALIENSTDGISVVAPDFGVLYMSPAARRIAGLGPDETAAVDAFGRVHADDRDALLAVRAELLAHPGEPRAIQFRITQPDGAVRWLEGTAMNLLENPAVRGLVANYRDVTEQRRALDELHNTEAQLRQAQKMEAIGRLAGGIAHDFNNLLSVILSYTDLLIDDLAPADPMRTELGEIRTAGQRAVNMTRQLLMFSRQQVAEPRVLDVNALLVGLDKMLRRMLGEDIELVTAPGDGIGKVKADPGQLEQVVMNLVVNARDAMPTGGQLTIETANVDLDDEYARRHVDAPPGPYVMIAVSDTGVGMDAATRARVFEPFFTTKPAGKGTGLGLSTVFGIVKQAGGSVWVYSEPGRGTTFKVYLPRTDELAAAPRPSDAPPAARRWQTILLVEDEEQVRAVAAGILKRGGYQVLVAQSPGEAVLISERHAGPIHLLLTDVVMPQMSGPELARRLGRDRPDMRLLCMSGYTDDAVVRHGVLDSTIAFLQKPITPDTLRRKVEEVLGG